MHRTIAVLCVVSTGCSFVWVRRAPSRPDARLDYRCRAPIWAPAIDAVIGIGSAGMAVNPAALSPDPKAETPAFNHVAAAATALGFAASAAYGYWARGRCRAAGPSLF